MQLFGFVFAAASMLIAFAGVVGVIIQGFLSVHWSSDGTTATVVPDWKAIYQSASLVLPALGAWMAILIIRALKQDAKR